MQPPKHNQPHRRLSASPITATSSPASPPNGGGESSVTEELFKYEFRRETIAILGARGAGKTSITSQFTRNEFRDAYKVKQTPAVNHVTVIVEERIYEVQ